MRINTEADAAPWVLRIKKWLRLNGFAGLDTVRVQLREMYWMGQAACGSDIVYVKPGLTELYFAATCVHEHVHHWLYKHGHQSGGFDGEGAASWAEYKFLMELNTPESVAYARRLRTQHATAEGVDYSQALETMLKRERAG